MRLLGMESTVWVPVVVALLLVILALAYQLLRVKPKPQGPRAPTALIVISDDKFEVPTAAAASAAFQEAGLQVVLVSPSGRETMPDQQSLDLPVSKAAADRNDPVWFQLLRCGVWSCVGHSLSLSLSLSLSIYLSLSLSLSLRTMILFPALLLS